MSSPMTRFSFRAYAQGLLSLCLLCFIACESWLPLPAPKAECAPKAFPELKQSSLWTGTFGDDNARSMGCLQIAWKAAKSEARTQLVQVTSQGKIYGYNEQTGKYNSSAVYTLPPETSGIAKSFKLFIFGSSVQTSVQQQQLCASSMVKIDYNCLAQSEENCWFYWSFASLQDGKGEGCVLHARPRGASEILKESGTELEPTETTASESVTHEPTLDTDAGPPEKVVSQEELAVTEETSIPEEQIQVQEEPVSEPSPESTPEPTPNEPDPVDSPTIPVTCGSCYTYSIKTAITGVQGAVAAFSPDNKLLVVAHLPTTGTRQLYIWERDAAGFYKANLKLVAMTKSTDPVVDMKISPDSRWLATTLGNRLVIWDLDAIRKAKTVGGNPGVNVKPTVTLADPQKRAFRSIAFHPKARMLFASNSRGIVQVWGTSPFKRLGQSSNFPKKDNLQIGINGRGNVLLSAQATGGLDLGVISLSSSLGFNSLSMRLSESWGTYPVLRFLRGKEVFLQGDDKGIGKIRLMPSSPVSPLPVLDVKISKKTQYAHNGAFGGADFRTDGNALVTSGADKQARVWKIRLVAPSTATVTATFALPGAGSTALFSPDGCHILLLSKATSNNVSMQSCKP